MAKRNFLVDGLSGVGKSAVYEELVRRGHTAVTADRVWGYHEGGRVAHDTWLWEEDKAVGELTKPEPEVLFICGSSRNSERFLPYFAKVFNLRIDEDTMRRRLEARTDDDWPLGGEGVELMLGLNRKGEKLPGSIDVDATRPIDHIVDEILRLAELGVRR